MDTPTLIQVVILGAVGMAYFSYGKRRKRVLPMLGGVGLMILPYFTTALSVSVMALLAVVLLCYFVAW